MLKRLYASILPAKGRAAENPAHPPDSESEQTLNL